MNKVFFEKKKETEIEKGRLSRKLWKGIIKRKNWKAFPFILSFFIYQVSGVELLSKDKWI